MNKQRTLIVLVLAGVTVALGFVSWWTFVPVAFVSGFILARKQERAVLLSCLGPALGWILMALVRDLHEDGRISTKLASLLHVRLAFAVYLVLFVIVAVPSFFASYSGSKTSEALR